MRIREENCNMILLAAVTLVSAGIAGGATLFGTAVTKPTQFTDRSVAYADPAKSPNQRTVYANDQPSVRVVGAPFVPNTNPRER
jgi:hypothetical protein